MVVVVVDTIHFSLFTFTFRSSLRGNGRIDWNGGCQNLVGKNKVRRHTGNVLLGGGGGGGCRCC